MASLAPGASLTTVGIIERFHVDLACLVRRLTEFHYIGIIWESIYGSLEVDRGSVPIACLEIGVGALEKKIGNNGGSHRTPGKDPSQCLRISSLDKMSH
jgi:hypothetical protein